MAYDVTVKQVGTDPELKGYVEIRIEETNVGSGDEAIIEGAPKVGCVLRQTCVLNSGTGTTIDPVLGIATNPAGVDVVYENGTAAASVNNEPNAGQGTFYYSNGGQLYHRSNVDTGTNNNVTTIYLVRAGW